MRPYYDEGGITIYHGDCREVMATLDAASVDLVVTDPPYFQPAAHYVGPRAEGSPKKSIGDMSILELAFKTWAAEMRRLVRDDGTIYFFCDGQSYPLAFTALYPTSKHVRPLIWDKVVSYNGYTWRHQHELIAWAELRNATRVPTGDGDVLRFRAVKVADRIHPAEKPLGLLQTLIGKHDAPVVFDPFAGSGSTLEAAANLGRRAVGIEIEERYCEIAARRLDRRIVLDVEGAA